MRSRRLLRELGLSSTQAGMLHQLMAAYSVSPPTFKRNRREMGPLKGFPRQPAIHSSHSV